MREKILQAIRKFQIETYSCDRENSRGCRTLFYKKRT